MIPYGIYCGRMFRKMCIRDRVKRSENGDIVNPFFLHPQNTVKEADELMHRYRISGVPICDDSGKLVGILTNLSLIHI